jgi:ABC-type multidrug transport system fused ATPase/permease subunit
MARIERQINPTAEQIRSAQAQHRLAPMVPQVSPFDQGNLSALTDHLEKLASLENRRQKAKLAGDTERVNELATGQKKLSQSDGARQLKQFEATRWLRILAGSLAQGTVLSLVISLLGYAFTRNWSFSPLSFVFVPIVWIIIMWNMAPPVLDARPSPKRARKLAKALGNRMLLPGVYSLVARPWMIAYVPKRAWDHYRARKAGQL